MFTAVVNRPCISFVVCNNATVPAVSRKDGSHDQRRSHQIPGQGYQRSALPRLQLSRTASQADAEGRVLVQRQVFPARRERPRGDATPGGRGSLSLVRWRRQIRQAGVGQSSKCLCATSSRTGTVAEYLLALYRNEDAVR